MSEENVSTGKRPGFLTVLCILTFIGSGLGVLGGLLGLIGSSALGMFAPQGTMIVQIIGLVAAGLCLYGAVQMWGLKKGGYMMYVLGAILSIVGSVVAAVTVADTIASTMDSLNNIEGMDSEFSSLMNDSMTAAASAAAWTAVAVSVVINALFIILYSVNKKHLTN